MTWREYMFMLFRFSLFFFIICFPFFRGCRVWYRAGGRIRFRRNQNGLVVGLRYVQPDMDRWLILQGYQPSGRQAGGAGVNGSDGGPRKLTADEVYELPEILAPRASDIEETDIEKGSPDELAVTYHGNDGKPDSSDNNTNSTGHTSEDSTSASTTALSSGEENTELEASTGDETTGSGIELPSRAAASSPTKPLFTTTMSTSCSICIEDFEEGEKIRLLPRCGHAFHTECILPWLTERQGCCPCCKEYVICQQIPENEENESGESNANTNGTNGASVRGPFYVDSNSNVQGNRGFGAHPFVSGSSRVNNRIDNQEDTRVRESFF